jgi:hypothetical protein
MKELKLSAEEDDGSAEGPVTGRENDVGNALCDGIESSVGRAQRRTCLPNN